MDTTRQEYPKEPTSSRPNEVQLCECLTEALARNRVLTMACVVAGLREGLPVRAADCWCQEAA